MLGYILLTKGKALRNADAPLNRTCCLGQGVWLNVTIAHI